MKKVLMCLCILLVLLCGSTVVFAGPHAVPGEDQSTILLMIHNN